MARRRNRRKPKQRRAKTGLNILTLAQTYLQTAIITQAAFRTSPLEFITGQQMMSRKTSKVNAVSGVKQWFTTTSSGYSPNSNGTQLTLPELFGIDSKTDGAVPFGGGGWADVKTNIELNGGIMQPIIQTAVLNIGFTVGKKLLRKQLGLTRKALKVAGMKGTVTV